MVGTPELVINNVRIFDGTDVLLETYSVAISEGSITTIAKALPPPQTTLTSKNTTTVVIDGTGCSLIPGLIDSHVHVASPQDLDSLAAHGITAACDMACFPASTLSQLRAACLADIATSGVSSPPRPHLLSAGTPVTSPGSRHSHIPGMPAEALLTDPADAEQFVRDRLAVDHSDYIKVVADVPIGPSQALMDAVVAAARRAGLRTVVHATATEAFRMAVRAGADCLTHVPIDTAVDGALAVELRERDGTAVVPTLVMMENVAALRGAEGASFEHALESARVLRRAGVRLLAGTDANSLPMPGMAVRHGESMARELELYVVSAGIMDPLEALRSATSAPAEYWGLRGRGRVAVGGRADMVLVEGEPWVDIGALRRIRKVYIGGRAVG
ncbi:hypothetical protein SLS62_006617 [Diatrype stigma]|uniref:Amidohydrolase-related domain-containing protein n=1 Tax=Diatrype stigma TaxID=117547 RepID=A0AAN9UNZ3_9PEZI